MDDDGLGNAESATKSSCHRPDNYVIYSNDIDDNCSCIKNDESCYDCNDVCGGDAVVNDECGECGVPGTTCLSLYFGLIPDEFSIQNIYPNPFNPHTNIIYSVPEITRVKVAIYDLRGKQIAVLKNEVQSPGYHSIQWDAAQYSSGVYFVEMLSGDFRQIRQVLHVK